MTRSGSNVGRGAGTAPRPTKGARSVRRGSLFLLVCVVGIVALMMVASLIGFVLKPDPAIKAGPMYVTLALITVSTLLMLFLALNATFLPIVSRRQAANVQLVMWATGLTGVVTGLLTLGKPAGSLVTRFVFAALAFVFITMQDARLARAGVAVPAPQSDQPVQRAKPRPRTRQRRGGRKR